MGKTVKFIIQLVLAIVMFLLAFAWFPSFSTVLFSILGFLIVPIKPLDEFFEKHKINSVVRIAAVVIIFFTYLFWFDGSGASNSGSSGNGSAGGGSPASVSVSMIDIAGTWKFVEERAIDCEYKFNSDGTWKYTSEGGSYDEGTYEIVDGVIKATGMFDNPEFKIIDKKNIENSYGEKLKRR